MFLSSFCTISYNVPGDKDNTATYGAVVGFFLFLISFGCTWLELPWLYLAEINPNAIRTNAKTNRSWNFKASQASPPMLDSLGGFGTFLFFGIVNLCFFSFIYFFYVETKGRSLEEIDIIFAKGFTEKEWYIKVGNELSSLGPDEVGRLGAQYGLSGDEEKRRQEVEYSPSPSVREEAVKDQERS